MKRTTARRMKRRRTGAAQGSVIAGEAIAKRPAGRESGSTGSRSESARADERSDLFHGTPDRPVRRGTPVRPVGHVSDLSGQIGQIGDVSHGTPDRPVGHGSDAARGTRLRLVRTNRTNRRCVPRHSGSARETRHSDAARGTRLRLVRTNRRDRRAALVRSARTRPWSAPKKAVQEEITLADATAPSSGPIWPCGSGSPDASQAN